MCEDLETVTAISLSSSTEEAEEHSVHSSDPVPLESGSSSSKIEDYTLSNFADIEILQKPEPLLSSLHSVEDQVPQQDDGGAQGPDESISGSSTMVMLEASQLSTGVVPINGRLGAAQLEEVLRDPDLVHMGTPIASPLPPGATRTTSGPATTLHHSPPTAPSVASSAEEVEELGDARESGEQPSPRQDQASPRTTQEGESAQSSGQGPESPPRFVSQGTQTRVTVRRTDILVVLPQEGGRIHVTQFQDDDPST